METTIIQSRRDLLLNWVEKNPILSPGEIGLVKITKNSEYSGMKIGNGHSKFNDLPLIKFNTNSGLVFGGIVKPDSGKPELSDSGSFWIAKDPGTYTEFGNLELEDFEIAILVWTGEKWEKQSLGIFKIDSELSGESEYPVQNKVIKNKFDEIEKTITTNEEAPKVKKITYSNLCSLKNNNKLVPGRQYQITDYQCITVQPDTQSAGHQFDIIVTANSTSKLSETARAIQHDGDTYFSRSKLEAWKIWYRLDNDTVHFSWADATNGKGVIYRMIDEWNNDCPYDFKNIQFKRYKITSAKQSNLVGTYLGLKENNAESVNVDTNDSKMFYTFSYLGELSGLTGYKGDVLQDASIIGNTLKSNQNSPYGVHDNSIKCVTDSNTKSSETIQYLNNIAFLTHSEYSFYYGCSSNSFGNGCYSNSFGNNCYSNYFGNDCQDNSFGNYYYYNSFGNYCSYNSFGDNCWYNSFGNDCWSNKFGNDCWSNKFGNYCRNNKLGNYCRNNKLGLDSSGNKLDAHYENNKFDNGVQYVTFNGTGTDSQYVQNYHIKQGVTNYTITAKPGLEHETTVAKRTDGTVIEYCEDDLKNSIENLDNTGLKYTVIK